MADEKFKLTKIRFTKIKQHRQIPGRYKLKSVTVSKTSMGKYFASILFEFECETIIESVEPINVTEPDFSMSELYVGVNGDTPTYSRYYRQAQTKLVTVQRKMSKRKKGSKNRAKQKIKVAKLHEKVGAQRSDFYTKKRWRRF